MHVQPNARQTAVAGLHGDALKLRIAAPAVDVTENDKSYTITAELAGMTEKDIDVALSGNRLTISGEKQRDEEHKDGNYHISERHYGSFHRSFAIPDGVDRDNVTAAFAKGVLTVVGVMVEKGMSDNAAWAPFVNALTTKQGTDGTAKLDWAAMLPTDLTTYRYDGSLTTPPCTEGVHWLLMTQPVQLSAAQLDKVKAALGGTPMPDNVWDLVFKPEYISKLKSCGVSFLDSPTDVIPSVMHYLGKAPFSRNQGDYAGVLPLLKSIRPYVTLFSSSGYINDLANGSLCVSMGYSGDVSIAKNRAIEGKTGQHIEALVPKTGATLFFDTMVIPADAPHPENAHKWINYILRPEVHASLTNSVFYANPNLASRKFIKPEIANSPAVYPSAEEMKKMVQPDSLNNDIRRQMTRIFTSFKTGL